MGNFSDEDLDSDVGNWDSSDEEEAPKETGKAALFYPYCFQRGPV